MTIHVRPAALHDYPSIAAIARESQDLHAQAYPTILQPETPGFAEDHVRQLIEGEQSAVYVAEEDERVLGYVFLRVYQAGFLDIIKPHTVAEISDIAVTVAERGKGIGHALFEVSREWARSRNAERLELTVWEFNRAARAFYERHGMQVLNRTMSLPLQ